MGRWSDPRVDHVASGRRCPLRMVISGKEGWPWERKKSRDERSENSASLVGAAGGTGVEHVGQLHGDNHR